MTRRGGKMQLNELVTVTTQTEDYSSGDLVISDTENFTFWAKVEDLRSITSDRSPLQDKHRDNRAVRLTCRTRDIEDLDLSAELSLSSSNTIYTVNDIYESTTYKFYSHVEAYSTAN